MQIRPPRHEILGPLPKVIGLRSQVQATIQGASGKLCTLIRWQTYPTWVQRKRPVKPCRETDPHKCG